MAELSLILTLANIVLTLVVIADLKDMRNPKEEAIAQKTTVTMTAGDIVKAKQFKGLKLRRGWQDQARELEQKHNTKAQETQKRAEEFKRLGYE